MSRRHHLIEWAMAAAFLIVPALATGQTVGTAFTYQGRLEDGPTPVSDACDFDFALWDAPAGGAQVGPTVSSNGVMVDRGLFSVQLDFGHAGYDAAPRYLEIAVQCSGDAMPVALSPRQPISPAPVALALPAMRTEETASSPNVLGGHPTNFTLSGVVGGSIGGGGISGFSHIIADDYGTVSGGLSNRAGSFDGDPTNARYATVGGGELNTATAAHAGVGGGFLNQATGQYAAIGGGESNQAMQRSAVISGGQSNDATGSFSAVGGGRRNLASGSSSTIPGGDDNDATAFWTFAAGRRAKANHQGAFVWADSTDVDFASTANNQFLIQATGNVGINTNAPGSPLTVDGIVESVAGGFKFPDGTVQTTAAAGGGGGGTLDDAYDNGGPGGGRTIIADSGAVFIDGPDGLFVEGNVGINSSPPPNKLSVGGTADCLQLGVGTTAPEAGMHVSSSQAGTEALISNERFAVMTPPPMSTADFQLRATSRMGVTPFAGSASFRVDADFNTSSRKLAISTLSADMPIAFELNGTESMRVDSNGDVGIGVSSPQATLHVAEGTAGNGVILPGLRTVQNAASANVVGGYTGNVVAPGAVGVTISGGGVSFDPNIANTNYAAIGGGLGNVVEDVNGTFGRGTIAGGFQNHVNDDGGTVGGGANNEALFLYSTVAGGIRNTAGFSFGFGVGAVVSGGLDNSALSDGDTVGGGEDNTAFGSHATVPGGLENTASGITSFAAGMRAKATHHGAFVWADRTDLDFNSEADNQFAARATGGVLFATAVDGGTGAPTAGVRLASGSGTWSMVSDRDSKSDIEAIEPRDVLERLMLVPVSTWRYKTQPGEVRHIGPMAQDFYEAFQVGLNNRHIDTIDAQGVALAAIQGLEQIVEGQRELIDSQAALINDLSMRLSSLEQRNTVSQPQ